MSTAITASASCSYISIAALYVAASLETGDPETDELLAQFKGTFNSYRLTYHVVKMLHRFDSLRGCFQAHKASVAAENYWLSIF